MVTGLACQTAAHQRRGETGVTECEHRLLTVCARERAALAQRDDDANFRALIVQARHITERSYETTLYDHMQAFRLLWRHLDDTGHLTHVHDGAQGHLASGALTAGEAADLRLFLTLYARVRGA